MYSMCIYGRRSFRLYLFLFLFLFCVNVFLFADKQHVLRKGETLYQISRVYDISLDEILDKNRGLDIFNIPVGTKISIPGEETKSTSTKSTSNSKYFEYVVEKNDTLFKISKRYNIKISTINKTNRLESDTLYVGQALRLPIFDDPKKEDQSDSDTRSLDSRKRSIASTKKYTLESLFKDARSGSIVSDKWPISGRSYQVKGKTPGVIIEGKKDEEVKAIRGGTVLYAALHSSFNNVIIIQGQDGMVYVYGGQSSLLVKQGDVVSSGQKIGSLGVMPLLQKAVLYFSIWKNDMFINPHSILG